jgi:hypothetical protein
VMIAGPEHHPPTALPHALDIRRHCGRRSRHGL